MSIEINRPTKVTIAIICLASLYLTLCPRSIALVASQQEAFGESGCEAYAWGYAVAQTQRYYVEICGIKGGKFLSFYAIERLSADPEKTKIQIDRVSRQNNAFIAVSGSDRYILTRDYLTLKRNGKIIFKEKVIKYKKLT